MKKTIVRNNQTILDVCIEQTGSLESIFELALLNNISITEALENGQELNTELPVKELEIVQHYKSNDISPATGSTLYQISLLEGINYWMVQGDFIVQGGIGQALIGQLEVAYNTDTLGDMVIEDTLTIN